MRPSLQVALLQAGFGEAGPGSVRSAHGVSRTEPSSVEATKNVAVSEASFRDCCLEMRPSHFHESRGGRLPVPRLHTQCLFLRVACWPK